MCQQRTCLKVKRRKYNQSPKVYTKLTNLKVHAPSLSFALGLLLLSNCRVSQSAALTQLLSASLAAHPRAVLTLHSSHVPLPHHVQLHQKQQCQLTQKGNLCCKDLETRERE